MVEPQHVHLVATKHVMRYLKGTLDFGVRYAAEIILHSYIDSDWVGSTKDINNTSGGCFSLGSGVISWLSRKKTNVSLITVEDKYIATSLSCSEAIWIRKWLT